MKFVINKIVIVMFLGPKIIYCFNRSTVEIKCQLFGSVFIFNLNRLMLMANSQQLENLNIFRS